MKSLKHLSLFSNQIQEVEVPSGLSLTHLSLSSNMLSHIPDSISLLQQMKGLGLDRYSFEASFLNRKKCNRSYEQRIVQINGLNGSES